ncbi:MAG: hypothetical protein AAFR28_03560 [Pseudomonadota bacterium]
MRRSLATALIAAGAAGMAFVAAPAFWLPATAPALAACHAELASLALERSNVRMHWE